MKYIGEINIQGGLILTNPTMEVKGIFDSIDEESNPFKYIQCIFVEQNDPKQTPHSRFWIVESEDIQAEINNNPVLSQFK